MKETFFIVLMALIVTVINVMLITKGFNQKVSIAEMYILFYTTILVIDWLSKRAKNDGR